MRQKLGLLSGGFLVLSLLSCQSQTPSGSGASPAASPAANSPTGDRVSVNGAGATFPAPLYQRWFAEYSRQNPKVQVSYQPVGSGAGVQQFLAQTLDFSASDAPLTPEERQKFPSDRGKPIQLPMVGGAVVLAYNLPGVDKLQLSRTSYCGIAGGQIRRWNDPAIAKDNPQAKLPDTPIIFVHRADGSGTTFILTNHLKTVCPQWSAGVGKSIRWPAGLGGKGNAGVTAQIQQGAGAIGYVEYAYANENKLSMASLQNQAGSYIAPTPAAAAKATEGATLPEDFALLVPDPKGKDAYPIVGLTWVLLYEKYPDPAKAEALKKVLSWALKEGTSSAQQLGYAPLPSELATKVTAALETVQPAKP